MKYEQNGQGIRIALASFDLRELRAEGNFLALSGGFSVCGCYQYGAQLLADLQAGRACDVVLLDDALRDMDAAEFDRAFYSMDLPRRPVLVSFSSRYQRKNAGPALQPEEKYCIIKPYRLSALAESLRLLYRLQDTSVGSFCEEMYRAWGLDSSLAGCVYLTDAVRIALRSPGQLAVRKEILTPVSQAHHVSVKAVDSAIRRIILELDEKEPPAWREFKERYGGRAGRLTVGSLLYAMLNAALQSDIRDG